MIVRITAKDARLPDYVLEKMDEKLHQRLDAYYRHERDPEASVIFVKVSEKKHIFKVEINMPYYGQQLRTENEERENAMPALDKGIDVLERQIKKLKTRLNRNLRQSIKDGTATMADLPEIEVPEEEVADYNVVRVKRYESKPMTTQDAILQMDLLGHNFFMFYNTDSGRVNTVYRRNDGDFGLIELEG